MDLLILSLLGDLTIYALLLVALPAFATWLVMRMARPVLAANTLRRLRWPLFGIIWVLPPIWLAVGHAEFEHQCRQVHPYRLLAKPAAPARSILVDQFGQRDFADQQTFSTDRVVQLGAVDFIETAIRPTAGTEYMRYRANQRPEFSDRAISPVVVVLPVPTNSSRLGLFPVYHARLLLKERDSGKLLAEASETVFGGGLAGLYLRAIKRDQDQRYLACGYVSPDIGTWRPTLSSDPRYRAYGEADAKFVRNSLQP